MKKIAIIGSTGQLGSDIKVILSGKHEIHALEEPDFKVENEDLVHSRIGEIGPEIVINTAAYHNVGECEKNPQQAFLINTTALKYLSEACNAVGATLVHFSTDYVFGRDQARATPYVEADQPGPVQVYGVSKMAGEKVLDAYCEKYFCLRISGLYGLKGTIAKKYPNFVEMMIQLGNNAKKKGEPLVSAQDQVLTFNYTIEIAKVVEQLIETHEYGLYHATCEGYCNRADFVRTLFNLIDLSVQVRGVTSDYFHPTYAQPTFSALENYKLKTLGIIMPKWEDALLSYIAEREKKAS